MTPEVLEWDAPTEDPALRRSGTGPAPWRPRILVVEDNATQAAVFHEALERAGYCASVARDGWEAVWIALHRPVSAVLLDLSLPRLDGYGVLEELRGREKTRTLPVLVVTGDASLEVDDRVRPHGVSDVMVKPVLPRRLVQRVRSLLEPR